MKRKTKLINIYLLKTYKFVLGLVEGDFSLQVCTERIALSTQKASKGASAKHQGSRPYGRGSSWTKNQEKSYYRYKPIIANAKDI